MNFCAKKEDIPPKNGGITLKKMIENFQEKNNLPLEELRPYFSKTENIQTLFNEQVNNLGIPIDNNYKGKILNIPSFKDALNTYLCNEKIKHSNLKPLNGIPDLEKVYGTERATIIKAFEAVFDSKLSIIKSNPSLSNPKALFTEYAIDNDPFRNFLSKYKINLKTVFANYVTSLNLQKRPPLQLSDETDKVEKKMHHSNATIVVTPAFSQATLTDPRNVAFSPKEFTRENDPMTKTLHEFGPKGSEIEDFYDRFVRSKTLESNLTNIRPITPNKISLQEGSLFKKPMKPSGWENVLATAMAKKPQI
ncbi:MAG: hypothetical protein H2069_01885 [Legionella sp.]|nr:hypothetical protein [Legionella sp.]